MHVIIRIMRKNAKTKTRDWIRISGWCSFLELSYALQRTRCLKSKTQIKSSQLNTGMTKPKMKPRIFLASGLASNALNLTTISVTQPTNGIKSKRNCTSLGSCWNFFAMTINSPYTIIIPRTIGEIKNVSKKMLVFIYWCYPNLYLECYNKKNYGAKEEN